MDGHLLWVYAHILLFVYWLGADLGVFILAQMTKNAALSVETRATLLKGAMLIDVVPRLCFPLMVPVGLTLATAIGVLAAPVWLGPLAWAWALVWCGLTLASARWEGTPAAQRWRAANLTAQAVLGVVFVATALLSLVGAGPIGADWFAWKLLFFGLCYPAAIMIDVAFGPAVAAFGAIATGQGDATAEAAYRKGVNATCVWVIVVYVCVALAGFFGTVKPGG